MLIGVTGLTFFTLLLTQVGEQYRRVDGAPA